MTAFWRGCLLTFWLMLPLQAAAHELDPGYLELSALDADRWRVTWRAPNVGGAPMPIAPRLPAACRPAEPPAPDFDGRAWSAAWIVTCAGGLSGGELHIDGLAATSTDTLVRYELAPGRMEVRRLTPSEPGFTIPAEAGAFGIFRSYLGLGATHILEGIDHLLFVFALVLLIADTRRLVWAITAFTLAHSLTLAASTLGLVALPPAPVEVVIALSIVFLARELSLPPERRDPLTARVPAIVSFGFGLIHGLGFAGALREIGLPQGDIPLALLAFNIGVELGQLAFIAVVLAAGLLLRRLIPALWRQTGPMTRAASYAIGTTSAFWVVERLSGF